MGRELGLDLAEETFAASFGQRNEDMMPALWGEAVAPEAIPALIDGCR